MNNFSKITALILVISLFAVIFTGCKKQTEGSGSGSSTDNREYNIDGTPVEVEPYTTESGEPYVNDEGYPVYQVKNTYDENEEPVLVVKTAGVDDEGRIVFKIQTVEDGVIKDAVSTDAADTSDANSSSGGEVAQNTTVFEGNSNNIPSVPVINGTTSAENQTTTSNQGNQTSGKIDAQTIKLGGVWGTVTKYKDNIYRGTIVESELTTLKKEKTYVGINAKFQRGIYIPQRITAEDGTVYNVKQVAYTRLFVYYDSLDEDYDWFTERGIFLPGVDTDPLVYIENNDSFELDAEYRDVHTVYLIELSK